MQNEGYEWQLNGNEITCDGLGVCTLEFFQGYWFIAGDSRYQFSTPRDAFYFVMDRCVAG